MKRSLSMLLLGIVAWTGGPVRAQRPLVGQPYQVPAGYEGYGTGTIISYGGYNYSIAGDGTMLLTALGTQSASSRPRYEIPAQGGLSFVSPDGTQAGGGYSRNGPETNAQGSYSDPQGNSGSGSVQFGGSSPGLGGAYRKADGSSGSGTIGANDGQFGYQDADGSRSGGRYQVNGQGGAIGGYQYDPLGNGYNGNLDWQGDRVQAQGEVRRPGYIPGTQDRIGGGTNIQGVNSSADAHYLVYDPSGRTQLGGFNGHVDHHGYNQVTAGGLGPIHGRRTASVSLNGAHSQVSANQAGNVAGIGGNGMGIDASSHGVHANGGFNVGGIRSNLGVGVDNRGVHVNVAAPTVRVPEVRPPSMPHLSTPSYSTPSGLRWR